MIPTQGSLSPHVCVCVCLTLPLRIDVEDLFMDFVLGCISKANADVSNLSLTHILKRKKKI